MRFPESHPRGGGLYYSSGQKDRTYQSMCCIYRYLAELRRGGPSVEALGSLAALGSYSMGCGGSHTCRASEPQRDGAVVYCVRRMWPAPPKGVLPPDSSTHQLYAPRPAVWGFATACRPACSLMIHAIQISIPVPFLGGLLQKTEESLYILNT